MVICWWVYCRGGGGVPSHGGEGGTGSQTLHEQCRPESSMWMDLCVHCLHCETMRSQVPGTLMHVVQNTSIQLLLSCLQTQRPLQWHTSKAEKALGHRIHHTATRRSCGVSTFSTLGSVHVMPCYKLGQSMVYAHGQTAKSNCRLQRCSGCVVSFCPCMHACNLTRSLLSHTRGQAPFPEAFVQEGGPPRVGVTFGSKVAGD